MKRRRRALREAVPGEDGPRFQLVDETSGKLTYTRHYGRTAGGRRDGLTRPYRLFLPPYSPAFTPVELAFSKLKTHLRTAKTRTRDTLAEALRAASDWLTDPDAKKWFAHCGYPLP